MKNWYFGGPLKNLSFKGGLPKNWYRGGLPKKRGVGQFSDLRGELGKKEGGGGLRGVWYPDAHYIKVTILFGIKYSSVRNTDLFMNVFFLKIKFQSI